MIFDHVIFVCGAFSNSVYSDLKPEAVVWCNFNAVAMGPVCLKNTTHLRLRQGREQGISDFFILISSIINLVWLIKHKRGRKS